LNQRICRAFRWRGDSPNSQGRGWEEGDAFSILFLENGFHLCQGFRQDIRHQPAPAVSGAVGVEPLLQLCQNGFAFCGRQHNGRPDHLGSFTAHFLDQLWIRQTARLIKLCQLLNAPLNLVHVPFDLFAHRACHDALHLFSATLQGVKHIPWQTGRGLQDQRSNQYKRGGCCQHRCG
jgi:hypothetical protein